MTVLTAALAALTLMQGTPGTEPAPGGQGVAYRIEASLDESTHVLRGRARLTYTNRAPQALDTLWLHQHLNAFRPNSAWARRELEFGERRFQDLNPAEHAFERLVSVSVDGLAATPVYPGAPDSTVVGVPLPSPLPAGATATVLLDWEARLATVPRRQGRRGRHYDFAQWYPRIAVYEDGTWKTNPLLPQGEFYGEFGSYDVTLELAADQVIGATGVPVEGDPGWAGAGARSGTEVRYRRDAYAPAPAAPLGLLDGEPANGRTRVRWRAERVHHFAWSASPDFVYEAGLWRDVPLHVLYEGDDPEWAGGEAIVRMTRALDFLDGIFGAYPYPQLTASRRLEPRGATEFPMLIMNSTGSQGQVTHEVTHQFAHAVLANNEWAEGWLDEGLTNFLTNWFWEETDPSRADWSREPLLALERAGLTQPIATPAPEFRDPQTYSRMTYTKPALVLRMLRDYLGADVLRRALRRYYEANRFTHVTEADLRAALEAESGQDLGWFFEQWLHGTGQLDYRLGSVTWDPAPGGGFAVRVEVLRSGANWMPVRLEVGPVRRRLDSRERRQLVLVEVEELPRQVVLDPDEILLDVRPENNRRLLEPAAQP